LGIAVYFICHGAAVVVDKIRTAKALMLKFFRLNAVLILEIFFIFFSGDSSFQSEEFLKYFQSCRWQ
jgi:hypothetical protein